MNKEEDHEFTNTNQIGIAWLMFPLFGREGNGEKSRLNGNRVLRGSYLFTKIIEGLLMIVGGFCILSASTQGYRGFIYDYLHIYFFVTGALLFTICCFRHGSFRGYCRFGDSLPLLS